MPSTVSRLAVLASFAASALVAPVYGQAKNQDQSLRPLSMSDFSFAGSAKRTVDLTQLDPRDADTFLWGNPTLGKWTHRIY